MLKGRFPLDQTLPPKKNEQKQNRKPFSGSFHRVRFYIECIHTTGNVRAAFGGTLSENFAVSLFLKKS